MLLLCSQVSLWLLCSHCRQYRWFPLNLLKSRFLIHAWNCTSTPAEYKNKDLLNYMMASNKKKPSRTDFWKPHSSQAHLWPSIPWLYHLSMQSFWWTPLVMAFLISHLLAHHLIADSLSFKSDSNAVERHFSSFKICAVFNTSFTGTNDVKPLGCHAIKRLYLLVNKTSFLIKIFF